MKRKKKILSYFAKNFFLPVNDFITGTSIVKHLKFLEESQLWSRNQIDDYQNERLRQLIRHVYKNVPFYKELFQDLRIKPEEIQNKEDLKKLPIITKSDLKRNQSKNVALNFKKSELVLSSSSGSTGEPFQFFTTKEAESFTKACAIRSWNWMGYSIGDSYVKISMNPRNSYLKKIQDYFNNSTYLSANQLTNSEFEELVRILQKTDPKFIRCYPVPLHFIASQIKSKYGKYKGESLIAINTTGSTLHENVRNEVEAVFGVKIFDAYSCEGGAVFAQCPNCGNYHPSEEYAISEFLSDSFTESNYEKPHRHITTDLYNYASPFIRYDTQDYLVIGNKKNLGCPRSSLTINKIYGRDSDILITPSGKYLIVENFVAYFEWIPEVEQIQVIQDKPDEIFIKMIVNKGYNSSIKQKIESYWQDYIGNDVTLIIEEVREIFLTKSGKRRTVIRNPDIKLHDKI